MTEYLDLEDVLLLHQQAHGCPDDFSCVPDLGLVEAAVARPHASRFLEDAYPDPFTKAAALPHSIVAGQIFVDGNKRTAWQCAWAFLGLNGIPLSPDFDIDAAEAFMLGIDIRSKIEDIAAALQGFAL